MSGVSDSTVVETARCWPDGVSGRHLSDCLVADGHDRREGQRAIQRALDRGLLKLGAGLRIYPGDAA